MIALHNRFGHFVRMVTYPQSQDGGGRFEKCAVCAATVLAEVGSAGPADPNTVCVTCGMIVVEPPFEDCDYFDVIMRIGRPIRRGARLRRTR
jgi:hypothetical protein